MTLNASLLNQICVFRLADNHRKQKGQKEEETDMKTERDGLRGCQIAAREKAAEQSTRE